MNCKKCGAVLMPDDMFCGSCGEKVIVQTENVISIANDTTTKFSDKRSEENQATYGSPKLSSSNAPSNQSNTIRTNSDNSCIKVDKKEGSDTQNKKSTLLIKVAVLLIVLLSLLTSFTVFNLFLVTGRIDTFEYDFLEGYKESLSEFFNISEKSDEEKERPSYSNNDATYEETTTAAMQIPTTVSANTTEVTTNDSQRAIPLELQQYANGLVYEGKTYRITLQEDDWVINYRSSPKFIEINKKQNNVLGTIKDGSEIYVEYIYNGTWAVFYKDGRYVFSSMYDSNDTTQDRLMQVV
ncbi:MAG: hypothetical protein ACI4DY_03950 [Monoglobaceae bacterium]